MRLTHLLERLKRKQFISIGRVAMDFYVEPPGTVLEHADTPGAEGFSGLAKAFFYAGSRSLLVSHWPVVSEAAVKLTTGMFDEIERNPSIRRAEALRRSMVALMEDEDAKYAHPMFWVPFSAFNEGGRVSID